MREAVRDYLLLLVFAALVGGWFYALGVIVGSNQ
jgi:hypothetical protein